jgi:energy-coupling factor transporter ATP-binding protein EcfA2
LIIADEPTGNLDYWNAQEIIKMLLDINADDVTVIMATHNRELVDQIQERVVVLNHGVIVSDKKNTGYDVNLLIDHHGKMTLEVSGASPVPPLDEPGWDGVGEIEITEVIAD